ncbi:TP53-regulated inhibitor of apoptosis 1-like [Anopheles aquasalis]|uniref:TP53-regulated inhibitor of apoptosis 1 n=1 Tax=Anopheles albimanus TaxID=7167 RepID=A0A182F836_ANOAL|nr:TP53-regulated inhibitor of apoptosis 1-like [Anopheles albimanus]XP_050083601.1 TP53-regulated inhibitor of apoptosis 1-like [Anopheles aquasalis]
MNSIGENCTQLKKDYDNCFNNWFSDRFLKGDTDDSLCAPLFKVYQQCVKEAMKQHHIEFKEIENDYIGDGQEKQEEKKGSKDNKS